MENPGGGGAMLNSLHGGGMDIFRNHTILKVVDETDLFVCFTVAGNLSCRKF